MSNRKPKNKKITTNDQEVDIRSFMKPEGNNELVESVDDLHRNSYEINNQMPAFAPSNHLTQHQHHSHLQSQYQNHSPEDPSMEDGFMKFFQVNGLINPKYDNVDKESRMRNHLAQIPKLSSEQLAEAVLFLKANHELEFLRELNVIDTGRKLIRQLELCNEMLRLSIDMSPQQFKDLLNSLVAKYRK